MTRKLEEMSPLMRIVREALQERGLYQKELAQQIDVPATRLSEMLGGTRAMPLEVAKAIDVALETNLVERLTKPTYTVGNECSEEPASGATGDNLVEATSAANDSRTLDAQLIRRFDKVLDITMFLRFCSTLYPENLKVRGRRSEATLARILRILLPGIEPERLAMTGRLRSSADIPVDGRELTAWATATRLLTKGKTARASYAPNGLDELKQQLRQIFHENSDTVSRVTEAFSNHGIVFEVVPKMPHIDGYSRLEGSMPIITVTKRIATIDSFAFTVMHELGHLALGHLAGEKLGLVSLEALPQQQRRAQERGADNFATNALFTKRQLQYIPISRHNYFASQARIERWAEQQGLNKWIVLGHISHSTGFWRWRNDGSRGIE